MGTTVPVHAAEAGGGRFRLPADPEDALLYDVVLVERQQLALKEEKTILNMKLAIWGDGTERCAAKVVSWNLLQCAREGLKEMKKDIEGRAFRWNARPNGAEKFVPIYEDGAPKQFKGTVKMLCEDVLPVLFPKLPGDLTAEVGRKWGEAIADAEDSFSTEPHGYQWEVRDSLGKFENREVLVIKGTATDLLRSGENRATMRSEREVLYDLAKERVRSARSTYRCEQDFSGSGGMPESYRCKDWIISEAKKGA